MQSAATTPSQYMQELPADRKEGMKALRKAVNDNLKPGFEEQMTYGMLGWIVPYSTYPAGYHVTPHLPLPYICIASQKNFIALYHMGLYADTAIYKWFTESYPLHSKTKLDMGKGCIRFKNPNAIPLQLVGELVAKLSLAEYIALYERTKPAEKTAQGSKAKARASKAR